MKFLKIIISVFLLFVLLLNVAYSSVGNMCEKEKPNVHVFFANGMFNDPKKANESKDAIEEFFSERDMNNNYKFYTAYNDNEEFLTQFLEVADQYLSEGEMHDLVTDEDINILTFFPNTSMYLDFVNVNSDPERYILSSSVINNIYDYDLLQQYAQYKEILNKGEKIIVIAHSQGNFYANLAYDRLNFSREYSDLVDNFKIIAVATPASYVANDGNHISAINDPITWLSSGLNHTVKNNYLLGHSMESFYLKEKESKNKLAYEISSILDNFEAKYPQRPPVEISLDYHGNYGSIDLYMNGYDPSIENGNGNLVRSKIELSCEEIKLGSNPLYIKTSLDDGLSGGYAYLIVRVGSFHKKYFINIRPNGYNVPVGYRKYENKYHKVFDIIIGNNGKTYEVIGDGIGYEKPLVE